MGRLLQIRVSAETFKPEEVEAAYPTLAKLAWTEPRPQGVTRGMLELPEALFENLSLGDWPEATEEALRAGISKAQGIRRKLEAALADWQPKDADRLSYELEDTLAELEKIAADL